MSSCSGLAGLSFFAFSLFCPEKFINHNFWCAKRGAFTLVGKHISIVQMRKIGQFIALSRQLAIILVHPFLPTMKW